VTRSILVFIQRIKSEEFQGSDENKALREQCVSSYDSSCVFFQQWLKQVKVETQKE
jgi:hypothetical protein